MRKILTHTTSQFFLIRLTSTQLLRAAILVCLLIGISKPIVYSQCNAGAGEIKGNVFIDFNLNGIFDNGDGAKSQAVIRVFGENNQLISQSVTDANGNYLISGLANNKIYKLELQKPQGYEYAIKGTNDVKFIATPSCDIRFGLQDKSSACNPNTANLYTTCFVKSGTSETAPTLVQLPFLFNSTSPMSKIGMQNQTGSVWGVAWNQSKQVLYSSAFVKYGTSLGVGGTGGIYISKPSAMTTNLFVDLKNFGIHAGDLTGIDPLDCHYSDFVGKTGLGDMDISDDDQYLYVTNLLNKSLVIIPTNQPSVANVVEIKIPDPGCNGGDYAVGAVEYRDNHLYIGVTCTAETSKNQGDFKFHIYEFNLLSRTFNIIFSTSFAQAYWLKNPAGERPISQWLTNISFVDDAFMVLGISDRTGHTYCDNTYPLTGQRGDILMLWKDGSGWHLENAAVAGSRIGNGQSHYEGPGHGEFFGDDFWTVGPSLHPETSLGSVLVLEGTQEVVSTVFDPIYESFAGGLHRYSTLNGKKKSAIQLYNKQSSAYGKSSGLGDLAAACNPLPIEIGDYVWHDLNKNGIQDPDEKPIPNLKISLFNSQCVLVGSTSTDLNGYYRFNSSNIDLNQDGTKDELQPFETYYLLVNDPLFNKTSGRMIISTDTFKLNTIHHVPGVELSDNNAVIYNSGNCGQFQGYPFIEIHTGSSGQNDFNFDIGFVREKIVVVPPPPPPPPPPGVVKKYDLALIKKVVGTGTVKSGDLVRFDIIVYNQGPDTVSQFEITDYIRDYFAFEANQNPGWTLSGNKSKYVQNAILIPGANVTIPIQLRLKQNLRPDEIINTAEVSWMKDKAGTLLKDEDSTPDEQENNDKGGIPNSVTDNIIDNNAIDEDDHDRESLPIADLALINRTVNTFPVKLNETVTFEMEVYNQGNVTAHSFAIVNYIPAGFKFEASQNPSWSAIGNRAVIKVNEVLPPGASKKVSIQLVLTSPNLPQLIDVAEITGFWDANNVALKDFDSTPDNNPTNDKGGQLNTATDNVINDNGTVDEDDHDPASIDIFDLALILTTDQVNPVKKNQDVLFHITVCNQGNIAAKNTGIVEYLPVGLTISPFDNNGWFLLGGVYRNTINSTIDPGQCATIDFMARVKAEANINNLLNRAEIVQAYDNTLRELTSRDYDSTPDYISDNDAGGVVNTTTDNIFTGNGIIDEDDADPAILTLMDLALIKKYTSNGSLKYKGTANFNIQIFNQGNTPVRNVEITDYLPAGFALTQAAINQGWVLSNGKASITLNGTILPGGNSAVDISLQNTTDVQGSSLVNVAEISKVNDINNADISNLDFDSTPDKNPSNDAGGVVNTATDNVVNLDPSVDEDDADPAGIPVYDLAIRKTLAENKKAYWIGDTIEFKIEVFNQGNVIAKDFAITDYLDPRYMFNEDINPGWTSINDTLVNFHPSVTLNPGNSYSTIIHVILGDISTSEFIPNYVEISRAFDNVGNEAKDYDSTFDEEKDNDKGGRPRTAMDNEINDHGEIDEDDHDGAESLPQNFDLALIKDIDHLIVTRNELLTFNILIVNQGLVTANEIEIVDYIPEGLILEDPNWVMGNEVNGITTAYNLLNETNGRLPQGGLKTGDTLEIFIKMRVNPSEVAGVIVNRTEISHALNTDFVADEDSDPDSDYLNDAGGVVFENSDGSSANFDLEGLVDDEDDADPAGIIIVDLERSIACQCLDNASTSEDGQFLDELSFRSVSGDTWFIFEVNGLYDVASPAPPAAPTPFVTGIGGFTLTESPLGDGTSIYTLQGIHVEGVGYSIILSNQFGVKLNTGVHTCYYNDPVLLKAQNNVCAGQTLRYEVKNIPGATYAWNLSGGGNILTNPFSNFIDIEWTGTVGSTYLLTVEVFHPDSCYNPLEFPITIGSTNGPISCIGSLQVSLNNDCEVQLIPQMLLIGGPFDYNSYAIMTFNKDGSLVPNNKLFYEHIGKTLIAKVINVCSGNSCWANIYVEDKLRPTITCVNDTIDCTLMKSYIIPFVHDNCDPDPERILIDESIENTPCNLLYSKIVTRIYRVKDETGNISLPCTTNIFLKRIQLDSIVFPDSFSVLTLNPLICNRFATDSLGHPLPSVTGVPTYRGLPAWPNADPKYCDYSASYEDIEFPNGKNCVKKLLRNWKFTIWFCNTFEQVVYPQLIEIVDTIAPDITCPYDFTATTTSFTCDARVWIPMPKVFDSCGEVSRISLTYPGGFIHDFQAQYITLPVANNVLTFRAYDLCHNVSECQFTVTVEDNTPPVAVCDRETVVTLDRFGGAWVAANVFDDGSYDDCQIESMEVRRMVPDSTCGYYDGFFHDSILFCCNDIGKEIMVMFRVTDANGNENTCMVIVEVQDKTIPHIDCPHDVTINCDYHFNLNDLSEFGKPTVSDNCNVDFREELNVQINQCREGYIDRIFIAGNGFGQDVCVQRITVVNPDPFEEGDIIWPHDFDTVSCITNHLLPETLPDTLGYPILHEDFCDLVGVSYEDHIFHFISGSDACYKIIRKWKVINWCRLYNPQTLDPIIYTHQQVIKIHNTTPPKIETGCRDTIFRIIDTSCTGGNAFLVATATDDCTPLNQLVWEYHIDFNQDGIEDRNNFGVGSSINASGFYPLGKHTIKYVFEDKCGNKSVCERTFEIINEKPPTAYCIAGLAVSLVPMDLNNNGSIDAELVTVWAKDFDRGSYHPCGYPLTYSIGRDTSVKSVTYSCDSIGLRFVTLCVMATNGKQDCCNTFIDVQDNNAVDFCNCVKFPPNVTITDCSQNTDPVVIDSRPTIGLCQGCVHLGTSSKDSVVQNVPNTCFVVYRTWTVKFSCAGEPDRTYDRTQIITVTTDLQDNDIVWPSDSVLVDNCIGSIDTSIIGEVPRFCVHGGNVMMMYRDREIRRGQDTIYYERTWTVFSKCAPGQSHSFIQILIVLEGGGLKYILPPDITVTDCKKSTAPDSLGGQPRTNCSCPQFQHSFSDSVVVIPNSCRVIYRRWTSFFNCPPMVSGTFKGTQVITIRINLSLSDIVWPADSIHVSNCRGSVDTAIIGGVPRLLKDFCGNVSIKFTDQTVLLNDTCRLIHRTWVVANECTANPKQQFSFVQKLKVDKPNGPEVDFPDDLTVTDCKKPLLPDSLNGYPTLNCPCNVFTHTFTDSVVNTIPNTCYVVYRKWTSVYNCPPDVVGTFKGTQIITVRINLLQSDIQWPNDTVIVTNCAGSVDTTIINNVPRLLKDHCGYVSIKFSDVITSQNDTCRFINRTWVVANECSANPKQQFSYVQVLKVTNPNGPRVDYPDDLTITDCDKPFLPDSLNGYPIPLCTACDSISFSYTDDTTGNSNGEICYTVNRTWSVRFICKPNFDVTVTGLQKITRDVELNPADITWPQDTFTSVTCIPTIDPNITGQPTLKKDYCGFVTFSFTDTLTGGLTCKAIKRTWTANNSCSLSQHPKFVQYLILKNQDPPSITCPNDTIVAADGNSCGKVLQLSNPKLNNNCNTLVTFTNNAPQVFPVGVTFVIFTAQDTCNHTATCTVKVTVIETVPPNIICPPDTIVPCSANTDTLNQFGLPIVSDNCPGVSFTERVDRFQDVCGVGTILRTFIAFDASGNQDSCTQRITIINPDPLDSIDILWPNSPISVNECDDYTDLSQTGEPEFDLNGITCLNASVTYVDTSICDISGGCTIERHWSVYDSCTDNIFTYTQLLWREDSIAPNILGINDTTVVANDSTCNNFITMIAFVDNCDSNFIQITNNSPYGANDFEDASGFYPPGETFVTFIAEDPCCNKIERTIKITVIDTFSPEFTCIKVVKKIKDDGCAVFNSQEFIGKLKDNCTDSVLIMSSFDRDDFSDTIRIICCDSIRNYEFTTAVKVYFKDFAGNLDSCSTFLQAVDQDTICGPTFTSVVKGLIDSRGKIRMPGVDVMLNDGNSGMATTDNDGAYRFPEIPNGGAYVVKPTHDLNPLNGVSTADIIHIQRHILGVASFTDPLKYIAADVNNSNTISASDIVDIRKLILGRIPKFTKCQSWKFLLSDYKFIDPLNPLQEDYPESYTIPQIRKNYYLNFTGIKMGDVDDSNDPKNFSDNYQSRNGRGPALLIGMNETLVKGREYEIELDIAQFHEMEGMQFGLHFDPAKATLKAVVTDESNGIREDMVYIMPENNSLRLSYVRSNDDGDQWRIKIKIAVNETCQLSDILEMAKDGFVSEAYYKSGDIASISLDFVDQYSYQEGLSLYQNIPNPFNQATIIPFQTPESGEITIRIINMNGKLVYESKRMYTQGYHEFEINKEQLDQSGIYYYQLKTDKYSLFRRMILIK